MQISKYLLAAAIFAAGLPPLIGQTALEEQDDRNQAREELNRKMAELEAQLQATEEPKPLAEEESPIIAEKTVEAPKITVEPVVVKPVVKPVEVEIPVMPAPVEPKPVEVVTPVVKSPAPAYPPIATKDALERARQDMRRKIAELDAQEKAPAPKPLATAGTPKAEAKVSPSAPVKTTATYTVSKTTTVATAKPLTPVTVDNEAINRARAETRRKIAELDAQEKMGRRPVTATNTSIAKPITPVKPATPVKPVTPAKDQAFTSTNKTSPQSVASAPAAPTTKSDARKEAEAQAIKASSSKAAPVTPTAASLIQAPPPAVSAAKQARLNELLGRYKVDKITPEQYHAERARILAE